MPRSQPWDPPAPGDEEVTEFVTSIEQTFKPMGGMLMPGSGDWRRVYFEDIDAYMDVTLGPGGRPIVGREGGWYVMPRLAPTYSKQLGALPPTEVSAWEVLGGAVAKARESALLDESPTTKFSHALTYAFGGEVDESGWGIGAQWLSPGYQQALPQSALALLGRSYAAPTVPLGAAQQVYPGTVMLTSGQGGFQRAVKGEEFIAAGIAGGTFAGGRGKQTGTRMYESAQLGEEPIQAIPWAGGEMGGQILNVAFPLYQATSTIEGQALVPLGTMARMRRPESAPLAGWGLEQLQQVTGVAQGRFAEHGEEFPLIYGQGGQALYASREPHWADVQVTRAHISLPESFGQTQWFQNLSEGERQIFRLTGGAIAGGQVVPSLEYETQMERGAGGSISGKGMGFKNIFAERDIAGLIKEGLSPAEVSRLNVMFQEAPKEWYTTLYGVGAGLGIVQPGMSLFTEPGRPDVDLIRRISGEMAKYTRAITTQETVDIAQGGQYLYGQVPGVSARVLEGGEQVELTRTAQYYFGPMAQLNRIEYPHGRSVYSGEELEHYRRTNPAMYDALVSQGQQSTAHLNILRSYWASYGKYDMQTASYADVTQSTDFQALQTGGGVLEYMLKSQYAGTPIQFSGGAVLPSARDISQMVAYNKAGEQVNYLVTAWERAVQAAQVSGYMGAAESVLTQRGFAKTAMELNVPGVMGPGTGSSQVGVGRVVLGEEQFRTYAREVFGRNPSETELGQLEEMVRTQNVMAQLTRFPHADPYMQQNVFVQMQLGFGEGAPVQVGREEIVLNPYHAAEQQGDYDADLYRITSISARMGAGGQLELSNEWAGAARGMREQAERMVENLRRNAPELVKEAERRASERLQNLGANLTGLSEDQLSLMKLGDTLRLTQYFASETLKHGEKEVSMTAGIGGQNAADDILQMVLAKTPNVNQEAQKAIESLMGKEMMARVYNPMVRDIGFRARALLGDSAAEQVMAVATMGYQKAVDMGIYQRDLPLGRAEAGQDPRLSFGMARLIEAWGSQSFFYGGGYAETMTGGTKWDPGKGEYRAPWKDMSGASPWMAMQSVAGQFAMFTSEGTPQQLAMMLSGQEGNEGLTAAIQAAQGWVGQEGGGQTAQDLLKSPEGMRYLTGIYKAAGWTDEAAFLRSEGILPRAMFGMMATRTREELARNPALSRQFEQISQEYQQFTGRSLAEDIAAARKEQGTIEALSGRIGHLGEGSAMSQILAMSEALPGFATEGVREGMGQAPTIYPDVWASSMGIGDEKRFGYMLQRATQGRFEQGWGQEGRKKHAVLEEFFKGREKEGYYTEEGAEYRGRVSEFGVKEFGDVGFTGKPDIVRVSESGGITVFDIKTYELENLEPSQLLFYGAAMERKFRGKVERLAYLRAGEGVNDDDLRKIIEGTATQEELDAYRKRGVLREIDLPQDLQATGASLLRQNLTQYRQLAPLLQYLSDEELEQHRAGLEGGYGQWTRATHELFERAQRNMAMGYRSGFTGVAAPQSEISRYYGIDLEQMGVRGARILTPRDFLADQGVEGAAEMSDQEIEAKLQEMGGRAAYEQGGRITVRQFTPGEMANMGDKWNPYTMMRGRIVHEAGHVYAGKDEELRKLAQAEVDQMREDDPFIQGVKQLYGAEWKEKAAGELVAHRLQSRFGATVGPLEREKLSPLDQAIVRLAGRIDISSAGAAGQLPEGFGEAGSGSVNYLGAAGASGGGGWSMQDLIQVFRAMQQAQYSEDDKPLNIETYKAAYRIMAGEQGVLREPEFQEMAGSGNYWNQNQFQRLTALETYRDRGKGGATNWRMLQTYRQMQSFMGTDAFSTIGVDTEQAEQAMGNFKSLIGGDRELAGMFKMTAQTVEHMAKFNEALERSTETLKVLKEHGDEYSEQQKQFIQKAALSELGTEMRQMVKLGGPEFIQSDLAQQAMQALGLRGPSAPWQDASLKEIASDVGGAIGGVAQRALGGYGLFTMRRLWGMTGGQAMQAEQVAAGEDLAAQQALASWYVPTSAGQVSAGLMGIQAQQQIAQAQMGRGAWMAWGGMQQALAGQTGEMVGALAPAAGAGLITNYLLGSPAMGLAAGAVAGLYGATSYFSSLGTDEQETAYRLREGGTWWERQSALAGAKAQGLMPGMTQGLNYDLSKGPLSGAVNYAAWWARTTAEGGWGDVQAWEQKQQQIGNMIGSGAMTGSPEQMSFVLRNWSENTGSFLGPQQLLQMAGSWQGYTGAVQNVNQLPVGLFEQMAIRGQSVEQYAQLARQIGGTAELVAPLAETMLARPQSPSEMMALGQYGAAGRAGWVAPEWLMEQFRPSLGVIGGRGAAGPGLEEMTAYQQDRFNRMLGGDRQLFSMYAAGMDVGLTQAGTDIMQEAFGGPQDWMVTTEAGTGMPIHTTTGMAYGGSLDTLAARGGGLRGIQQRQMATQREQMQFQQQQALSRFQMGYAVQTGEVMPGMGGAIGPALYDLARETGGMWGLQDESRQAQYDLQMQRFGFQDFQMQQARESAQMGYAVQTGRLGAGPFGVPGALPGALVSAIQQTGGMWGIQDATRGSQFAHQMAGFGFQEQNLALSEAIFGTQQAHWQEDWNVKWERLQVQKGWEEDAAQKQKERNLAADEWWLYRHEYQGQRADIQYERSMEDLDEGIRFATGRQKLQLMKQKERVTEDYSMEKGYMEAEKEYWEKMKDWREEDEEDAESKREIRNRWAEEDLLRSKKQHDELSGLQAARFDIQKAQLEESKAYAIEQRGLEEARIALERAYWEAQQDQQAEKMGQQEKLNKAEQAAWEEDWERSEKRIKLERQYWLDQEKAQAKELELTGKIQEEQMQLREDQFKLMNDQQEAVARFQLAIDSAGEGVNVLNDRVRDFNNLVRSASTPSWMGSMDPNYPRQHSGGPVGWLPGGVETNAILEEGEYVVPKGGALAIRDDDRMVNLLSQIRDALVEGNGRFQIMVMNPERTVENVTSIAERARAF